VLGAFLSGAGPSVALLVRRDTTHVERVLASMYEMASVAATVRSLKAHEGSSTWVLRRTA
jgi:homoserine kinase